MEFIDVKKQYQLYKEEIDREIHKVLDEGNFILGRQVEQIEQLLAAYAGVNHCLTVSSGTDSLMIALMALGIGPGDEVITTPFTWISTTEVIKLVGATPVFVDIDPDYYNIDVDQIEAAITPKTRAIMPVSLFGQMPDYALINKIADKYGIPVIEDGAQSFGATQNGLKSCGVTTVGSTSFFPAKPLGCYGDGGALFTNDSELNRKMKAIRTHGAITRYEHFILGLNGRFDTIQAAVLLAKFPHFPSEIEARERIGARYTELLKEVCVTPKIMPGNTHIYAQYTICVPNRDHLGAQLKSKGIPNGFYYPKGIHEYSIFADKKPLPVVERVSKEVISLPMHPWLTCEEQDFIVEEIKAVLEPSLMASLP
jgi:UDP-2-acetamido-2-deoxy-ribo-hexuluronate aminotransferase